MKQALASALIATQHKVISNPPSFVRIAKKYQRRSSTPALSSLSDVSSMYKGQLLQKSMFCTGLVSAGAAKNLVTLLTCNLAAARIKVLRGRWLRAMLIRIPLGQSPVTLTRAVTLRVSEMGSVQAAAGNDD